MSRIWAIATVMSGQEFKFCDRLAKLEIDVSAYIPIRRYLIKPRHVRKPKEVSQPAFRRYVFVSFANPSEQAHRLARTHVEHRFMRLPDGAIASIRGGEVERIQKMEASGDFDDLPIDASLIFQAGKIMIVQNGIFEDENVQVLKTPKKNAKAVLVEIMGKPGWIPLASFGRIG